MDTEPVFATASIVAALSAVLALLIAFGVPLSHGQTEALLAFVAVAAPLVAAMWGRTKAYSPDTVRNLTSQP
jgi:hypothetical protein